MDEFGTKLMAWAPLAEGQNGMFTNPTLTQIGEKYGKTAAQVALRWLLQSDVIISRDVISDMHTTEFHMMLTSDH